jgi:quinolinate synthase
MKQAHPDADILVHPESPAAVIEQADVVGSTSVLLKATTERSAHKFIVATDRGIFYQMQKASPHKTFLEAPTAGHGATCRSCAQCPWMAMNSLELVEKALRTGSPEIIIDRDIAEQAARSLNQMLHFKSR